MKESSEIAIELTKQIANSPKVNGFLGAGLAAVGNFFDSLSSGIPTFMFWGGAVLLAVSIYNQFSIAVRNYKRSK